MDWRWSPPVIQPGQTVIYHDHQGNRRRGECRRIVTHYTERGVAYHIYEMADQSLARGGTVHVSESQIVVPG